MSITRSAFVDRQMAHIGNVRHGVATGPWRVEFDAKVHDDTGAGGAKNCLKIKQGSVVVLNKDGEFELATSTNLKLATENNNNCAVPCISLKNVFDADVTTGIEADPKIDQTVSAMGNVITAIPVTSGYELETTEYDTAIEDYKPGDLLIAGTDGKVTRSTDGSGVILGVVSKAPAKDYFNNKRLAFFTTFLPAGVKTTSV